MPRSVRFLCTVALLWAAAVVAQPVETTVVEDVPMPTLLPQTPREQVLDDSAAGAMRPKHYEIIQERPDRLIAELPNRMIVIAQRVEVAPVASAQVWVKTGSIFEQEHVGAGLSHFLEHLLSGGTTQTRSEADNNAVLGRIGARTNAATSLDNVHYYVNTSAQHVGEAIDLLSDWMTNASITPAEYEREREVIQREFEHGAGDPGRIFWKLTQQARYANTPGHPGRHPTIGYLDEFLQISRDEIYDFHKRMYVPNNMVFVVAGDIDPRSVVDQVAANFADVPAGELPEVALPVDPDAVGGETVVGYADIQRPRLRLAWPGTRLGAEGDYALDLLAGVLGEGEQSRLTRVLRDDKRLVNAIDAYNWSLHWGEGFFGIDAEAATPGADLNVLAEAILEQVRILRDRGVSDAELARAKRQTLSRVLMANQSAEGIASRLARDVISTGDPDYLTHYAEAVQQVTAAEVQAAANRFLVNERLMRIELHPLAEGRQPTAVVRPDEPEKLDTTGWPRATLDNAALLADLRRHVERSDNTATAIEVDEVELHTLGNGLRLVIGRSTVVPAVSMQWFQLGGLLADEPGREGVASSAAAMLVKGTTTRSADDISRTIEDLGAALGTQCGNNTVYASAVALRQDWPTVLDLLADVVQNPTFPEDEWAKLQPRMIASIQRQKDRWGGELNQAFRSVYCGQHPWSQTPAGRAEVVQDLTVEDLRRFHRTRLSAADSIIAVFGDVDPAEVRQKVEAAFDRMPRVAEQPFEPRPFAAPPSRLVVTPTAKPMAAVQVGFGPGIRRQDDDYAAMQVVARLLSDFPSGRLEQALRGQGPGLVYAVGAQNVTGIIPGYFSVVFNTQPATVGEALQRVMTVVEQTRSAPPTPDELARARASVQVDEAFSKQTNSDRAMSYALDVLYGLPLDDTQRMLQRMAELDATTVQEVARKRLTNPVAVIISNESLPVEELESLLAAP